MGDARRYDAWAAEIAAGDLMGREVFYQAPLYPYFLGTIYTITGRSLLIVRVCQVAMAPLVRVARTYGSPSLFGTSRLNRRARGCRLCAVGFLTACFRSPCWTFLVSLSLWIISGLVDRPNLPLAMVMVGSCDGRPGAHSRECPDSRTGDSVAGRLDDRTLRSVNAC